LPNARSRKLLVASGHLRGKAPRVAWYFCLRDMLWQSRDDRNWERDQTNLSALCPLQRRPCLHRSWNPRPYLLRFRLLIGARPRRYLPCLRPNHGPCPGRELSILRTSCTEKRRAHDPSGGTTPGVSRERV